MSRPATLKHLILATMSGVLLFFAATANAVAQGDPKGEGPPRLFDNRDGEKRKQALRDYGGTEKSEEAVANGLKWLVRHQQADGRWLLDVKGDKNPAAATGLALLPFLAAGKTHIPGVKNPYQKVVDKGLKFLIKSQDEKTGYFGGTMYGHALATTALCEAYAMSQDPALRKPAQRAINLIVSAQHEENGGWSYSPDKSAAHRDMSISGWQMMALKSGQPAGLVVSSKAIDRCKAYLSLSCSTTDAGYCYSSGNPSTPRMTAVGLLCRMHLQKWGPSNPLLIKAMKEFIKIEAAEKQDVYFYYYATQVKFHLGGKDWEEWNGKMREYLIKKQDKTKGANKGSWSPEGDPWGGAGGRMMVTSLNLLTLQVYYRHAPLVARPAKKEEEKK